MLLVAISVISTFFTTCSIFESEKPVLFVKPMTLLLTKNANSDILVISNRGDAELSWEITDKPDWLEVSKSSGKVTTDEDEVIVTANVNQEAGEYSGTIRIESNGGNKEIIISFDISIWVRMEDIPTPRIVHAVAAVNGKIYAIGGIQSPSYIVEEYDPATDTWTKKADMPTNRGYLSCSVVNGKIYAIGGFVEAGNYTTYDVVEEYDPATDTWTTKASMPTARWGHSTATVNGKIYAIGGAYHWPAETRGTVEEYDPATDTWTTKASIPTPRWLLSCSVVNGKIYAIGGEGDNVSGSAVEEYDPATDTWTTKASMPTSRWGLTTGAVNGKIYAIAGGDIYPPEIAYRIVEEYDPVTDSWTTKSPMPIGRLGLASDIVNEKIYVIGGGAAEEVRYNVSLIGLAEAFVYEPGLDSSN